MVEAVFTILMTIAIILEIVLLLVNISILIATIIEVKKGKKGHERQNKKRHES